MPSPALRLSDAERDHLYRIAGAAVPARGLVPRHITPGVQRLVDRLDDVPLAVFSAAWDIVRWNRLWAALLGDPSLRTGPNANLVWRHFTEGHVSIVFDDEHEDAFSRDLVGDLRPAVGTYPTDAPLAALVARLRSVSPAFEAHWAEARLAEHRSSRKTVTRSPVGPITLDCDVLTAPGSDLRIVAYTVVPGSENASRLGLLRVTGLESLGRSDAADRMR